VLARHDYDERILAESVWSIAALQPIELTVRAVGGSFVVEVDGREVLRAEDARPHPVGRVGIRTSNALLRVELLKTLQIDKV
jgi:hypothetical protein